MKEEQFTIVEGIESVFHYHIAENGKALCGRRRVMKTAIPLKAWGTVSHLKEKYCEKCEKIFNQREC